MAAERKLQTAAPAFERRRAVPVVAQRSAAPAPSPVRSLQVRLGNQAAQSVARSIQSSKTARPPAPVAKQVEAPRPEAKETAKAARPAPKEKEKEKEKQPGKGEAAEKAAPPSAAAAIAPAVKAVQERSARAKKRGDEKALVGSAQDAAKDPQIEGSREASVATVTTLDAAKTAKVRRDQFKADLKAAIKAATPEPKTEDQADEVMKTGGKKASNALKGSLATERDAAAGGMKGAAATEVAPAPSGAKTELTSEAVGAKPAPVSAAPIVPAPLPPERLDYSSDRGSTDQAMEQSGVTTEQLGKGNEPQFNKTLSERSAAEKHEATAEAKYRQSEAGVQAQAKAGAQAELPKELGGIHGMRELRIGEVTGQQNATKTKAAQERERVTTTINGFKDKTRADVGKILEKMETDAAAAFEGGLARAEEAYEKTFEDAKGGVGTWLTTWGDDWEKLIESSLRKARDEYFRQVDLAIDAVANLVDARLEEAKARVAAGRLQVEEFVKTLDGKVKEFGEEALKEVSGDFDAMGSEIDQRRDALIDKLAQQYKASYERMSAKEEALREANKSFWQRVYDATVGVIKKILAFKDMLVGILAKAAAVVVDIISDPIGFLGNLVSAVMNGLENFMANIATHLEKGLMEWLFGALGGAGLQMPEKFDLKGVISIILQVLGLTYANFRARAVTIVGEPVVAGLEKTAEIFKIVMTRGISGLWELLKEKLTDLKSMVMDAVLGYIKDRVLIAGVTWIIGLLNPVSAFFKACKAIYDIVMFFINRGSQIMTLVNAIIDSIAAIAKGQLASATKWVENALAKAIPVAIGFLAALLGLGDISGTIKKFIDRARAPVNKAMDWVINTAAKGVGKVVAAGKAGVKALISWWKTKVSFKAGGEPHSLSFKGEGTGAQLLLASTPKPVEDFLDEKEAEAKDDKDKAAAIKAVRALIKRVNGLTKTAASKEKAKEDETLQKEIEELMNEMGAHLVLLLSDKEWGTEPNPAPFDYPKRRAEAYPTFYLATGTSMSLDQAQMAAKFAKQGAATSNRVHRYRPTEIADAPDKSAKLGLGEGSQVTVGKKLFFEDKEARGGGVGTFKTLLGKFGFTASASGWDVDHVVELQLGGKDEPLNLWPLPKGENRSSGSIIKNALIPIPGKDPKPVKDALSSKKTGRKPQGGLWLLIKTTRQL
ncbi:MAG TPA: hypothetical protein VF618_19540 [Thermoanaerobaculia bacterium]